MVESGWPVGVLTVFAFRIPDGFGAQQASAFASSAKRTPSRFQRARPGRFTARVPVFVLAAASVLGVVSAPARAEGAADTELDPRLAGAVRRRQTFAVRWEIDKTVIAAAEAPGAPQVRDELVPVLVTAHARHAAGYDRLRAALCTEDGMMSRDRARACSTLPPGLEDGWRRSDHIEQWMVRGVATAAYAGAITAAAVERDESVGRGIATAAGVPVGAAVGIFVLSGVANEVVDRKHAGAGSYSPRDKIVAACFGIGGAIAGSVAGGWVAHALAASPGSRVPVTAVGLAPVYLTTLVITLDW